MGVSTNPRIGFSTVCFSVSGGPWLCRAKAPQFVD